jgi:hypothetical protein
MSRIFSYDGKTVCFVGFCACMYLCPILTFLF